MARITYGPARPEDHDALIDFANYVFSHAHSPTDFPSLLPKAYAPERRGTIERWHFIAKEDGRIRGLVADRPETLTVGGDTLRCGLIGTVSVHPYARGEGHMKHLMAAAIADAQNRGCDLMELGGQRQRYNWYGFEQAGAVITCAVTRSNVRKSLAETDDAPFTLEEIRADMQDAIAYAERLSRTLAVHGAREPYFDTMRSWNEPFRLVRKDGRPCGYVCGSVSELCLEDEGDLYAVLKALLRATGAERLSIPCNPWEKDRIKALSRIAEDRTIGACAMIRVLNWPRTVGAFLKLAARCRPLADGVVTLQEEGQPSFTIRVTGGVPAAAGEGLPADIRGTKLELERLLFSPESAVCGSAPLPAGWLPLPFYIPAPDRF